MEGEAEARFLGALVWEVLRDALACLTEWLRDSNCLSCGLPAPGRACELRLGDVILLPSEAGEAPTPGPCLVLPFCINPEYLLLSVVPGNLRLELLREE